MTDHCEYCGSEELDLAYTSDGNVLLCDACRARYELELEPVTSSDASAWRLDPGAVFRCEPDESAGLADEYRGLIPPYDVEPDDEPAELGPGELGPGERIVDGERRYSAAWLDGPRALGAAVVAAIGLLVVPAAIASSSPPRPDATPVHIAGPLPGPGVECRYARRVDLTKTPPRIELLEACYRTAPAGRVGRWEAS